MKPSTPRDYGIVLTRLIKFGGLVLAMYWGLFRADDPHLTIVLAIATFMVSGGISLSSVLDRLWK